MKPTALSRNEFSMLATVRTSAYLFLVRPLADLSRSMGATFFRRVWANYNITENLLHIYQGAPRAN
jgi:hypothetical protein